MKNDNEARWLLFDVEADSLEATKIHCLSYEDSDGNKGTLYDYQEMRDLLLHEDGCCLVGHNISRWDIPTLERLLDIHVSATIIDTLALAWYLEPPEPGKKREYGLEHYGEVFGLAKPEVTDWVSAGIETYRVRCETDREINLRLFRSQLSHLRELYPDSRDLWAFLRYLQFKMRCARLQEESGWKLDEEYCRQAIKDLEKIREQKKYELSKAMPLVPVIQSYDPPKRQYNSDGELSVLGRRWQEKLGQAGLPPDYAGTIELVVGYDDPNPGSTLQVKTWLYDLGWKPQTIKVERNKKTGETKEIPQINKEKSKGGGVCESVKLLYDKEPALENLDSYYVLNHRISILRGFLRDVDTDGYLHANVQGLTNTLRFKHAEIVNLPKPEAKYGAPIRHCLVAHADTELCGADMASLEDRLKQHYIFPFDPEYVHELNKPDYDPHLDLAGTARVITLTQILAYKDGSDTSIKPIRNTYKNGNYACQYGAGVPRLEITCGCDKETAERIHKAYWTRNWSIKAVAKEQVVKTLSPQRYSGEYIVPKQMWLYNPISGFWYSLRQKKDIFSTLVQGSAVYCFDTWVAHVLQDREQLTAQFHDEIILEVQKGHREEITSFLEDTIRETNEYLGLNRELGIGIQFGNRYSEIH